MKTKSPPRRLSLTEQRLAAIEFLALGSHYILNKSGQIRKNFDEIAGFLEHLSRGFEEQKESESEALQRRYRSYLRILEKLPLPIRADFREQYISGVENAQTILQLLRIYLKDCVEDYNDAAVQNYCRRAPQSPPNALDKLYRLVVLKYAIKRGLPLNFSYKKLFSLKEKAVRALPLAFSCRLGHFNLIARDYKDDIKKHFIAGRILKIKDDFYSLFYQEISRARNGVSKVAFDLQDYYKTTEANLGWPKKSYVLEIISEEVLDHFQQKYAQAFQELEVLREGERYHIRFESHDEIFVMSLLFFYEKYARLLEPLETVQHFKQRLKDIQNHYAKKPKKL